jgi:hypothetical protein
MKRFARVTALIALALFVATAAMAIDPDDLHRVTFVNNTGYDIYYLFFSPGDSDYWGADILGTTRTLDNGESLGFFISYPGNSFEFDFMAIDEDGDAYFLYDHQLQGNRDEVVEITFDNYSGGYDMGDMTEVNFTNTSGYDMWYVFFSPGDSSIWGVDMLDESTILYSGETLSLYVPVSSQSTRYDFHSVDEDEDEYQFWVEISNRQNQFNFEVTLDYLQF